MDDNRILDCGHKPSQHSKYTTGTARTTDGREICWTCAVAREKAAFANADRYFAYVSCDGARIETWTGGVLAHVIKSERTNRRLRDGTLLERFLVRDLHGRLWQGHGPGRGMYCRLRRRSR